MSNKELEKPKKKSPKIKASISENGINTDFGDPSKFAKTYNSSNQSRIINELYSIIDYCSSDPKKPIFESQVNSFISAIDEMGIKDPIESSLVIQMLVTHDLFLKCSHRANIKQQNPERVDDYIRNLTKLSRTFTNQLKAYVSYKNQGQQKVKVEHVHISEGGQAIFGNINTKQNKEN